MKTGTRVFENNSKIQLGTQIIANEFDLELYSDGINVIFERTIPQPVLQKLILKMILQQVILT